MRKTVVECVAEQARDNPDKMAVVTPNSETSYGELYELACGFCDYLKENGVKKGDFVVFRGSQDLEFPVIYLGIHLAGGVATPLEKSVSDEGMMNAAKKLKAPFILAELEEESEGCQVISRGDVTDTARSCFTGTGDREFPELSDSADILYTTGTTGAPKGVEISHNAIVAMAENAIYGMELKEDTVLIDPVPVNHAGGIRRMDSSFVNGSTFYILNGMTNMREFFDALGYKKGRVGCYLVPSAIRNIFAMTGNQIGKYRDQIDFIESGSAPLPETDRARLRSLLPDSRLYISYGLSESGTVCIYDYNKYSNLVGCIGQIMPNAGLIIVNDEKEEIKSDEDHPGRIACKGEVNMKGYVNEPEQTKEILDNGVIYTNDVGYVDENGFVFFVGREGDVINVGGLKVAPTEVEDAALSYDPIEDCICISVDDKLSGNALKLLVVLKEGSEFNPKEIKAYLSTKLESFKVPRFYEEVSEVKKTYNGKLDRKAYRNKPTGD